MTTPNMASVTWVINACNHLMTSGLYLGDPSITILHPGEATGNMTDSSDTVPSDESSLSHAGNAMANAMDSSNTIASDDSSDCLDSATPDPAILHTIVHIDSKDFWLTADSGYLGPNTVWKEIADVKPSCTITNPGLEPISSDFKVVIHMLQDLTEKCAM
ncbi:hypothetical protein BKA83DRAFT_4126509 [Pisolithus microcarpus]|nr:hypothetical protein BKA83DRAFT_4126509 [Pisolithus microcarpus]